MDVGVDGFFNFFSFARMLLVHFLQVVEFAEYEREMISAVVN